jgi:hypothetical protein
VSGLRGDIGKIRKLEAALRDLPTSVGHKVATASAATITALAQETFRRSENAYGDVWSPGAEGQRVTLHRTGSLENGVAYVAIGNTLRARLGARYAKYQVGQRPVFPRNGARLPLRYVDTLSKNAAAIIREAIGVATR